jgi:hypothetical protein
VFEYLRVGADLALVESRLVDAVLGAQIYAACAFSPAITVARGAGCRSRVFAGARPERPRPRFRHPG